MGKKVTNHKLLKQGQPQTMLSAFNQFANKMANSHSKRIEKVDVTKQRLMESKKNNRMVKVSKRTSKFALMDDEQPTHGLTHRGTKINQLKHFNDMNFEDDGDDDEFMRAHEDLNFTGFDEGEQPPKKQDDRPKSKTEVYKEIIEKSKLHKHLRQEVYEENFEKAVELDEQFPGLVSKLKFRTRDTNLREKMGQADHEFDKLASQLKEDERVMSNKVMERSEKYTDKVRRKKNEQLNKIMKDSSDEEDIRAWAKEAHGSHSEDEEDELDDIQLSSGEEEGSDEEQGSDDGEQEGSDDGEQEGSDDEEVEEDEQDESQDQDGSEQQAQNQSEESLEAVPGRGRKGPAKRGGKR